MSPHSTSSLKAKRGSPSQAEEPDVTQLLRRAAPLSWQEELETGRSVLEQVQQARFFFPRGQTKQTTWSLKLHFFFIAGKRSKPPNHLKREWACLIFSENPAACSWRFCGITRGGSNHFCDAFGNPGR